MIINFDIVLNVILYKFILFSILLIHLFFFFKQNKCSDDFFLIKKDFFSKFTILNYFERFGWK